MTPPKALVLALGDKGGSSEEATADSGGAERAEAGQALADAVKSGDGAAIYDAFEALQALCKEA